MDSAVTPARAQLTAIAPRAHDDIVAAILDDWPQAATAGVDSPLVAAHFLTQLCVETDGLTATEENLNYSAARLLVVFPKYFNPATAALYQHSPQATANRVYGGRLGNTQRDDGWRYRGGGMLQTTGRAGYRALSFEMNPEKLREPATAFATACSEWKRRGCSALARKDNLTAVRRAINGGTNGLDDAKVYLTRAKKAFGA